MGRIITITIILLLVSMVTSCKTGEEKGADLSSDLAGDGRTDTSKSPFINPESDFVDGTLEIDAPDETDTSSPNMDPITLIDEPDEESISSVRTEERDNTPGVIREGGRHTLLIKASGECWVSVNGPSGGLFAGTLNEGEEKAMGPVDYFLITLGKPENAEVHFDGKLIYGGEKQPSTRLLFALPEQASVHLPEPKGDESTTDSPPAVIVTPSTGGYTLKIDITTDCWVEVMSGGETVLAKLLREGDTRTVGPADGFDITLGYPKGAILFLNGREVFGPNTKYPTSMNFTLPATYVPPPEVPEDTSGEVLLNSSSETETSPTIVIEPVEPGEGDTESYIYWIDGGQWLMALESYDLAIINFENAYDISPNDVEVNMLLGKAHRGAGNLDKSLFYLERALALDADDPDSILEMGYTQEAKGNKDKAIEFFTKYLTLRDIDEVRAYLEELKAG